MSEAPTFSGEGFKPFPNVHSDNEHIGDISNWEDRLIEEKIVEYWQFMNRKDIQPRARKMGQRILNHLNFEMECRYGSPELMQKIEDEVCGGET